MKIAYALILFLGITAYAQDISYEIILAEDGEALVLVAINNTDPIDLPLPIDVPEPEAYNAAYILDGEGAEVEAADGGAVVAYKTRTLTSSTAHGWIFDIDLGRNTTITVSLPKNAEILVSRPTATVADADDSIDAHFWQTDKARIIYQFRPEREKAEKIQTTTTTIVEEYSGMGKVNPLLALAAVFIVAASVYLFRRRRK
jgi:hypothetical protein